MKAKLMIKCPDCASSGILEDPSTGEYYCGACGRVIGDRMADEGPEWRDFRDEESQKRDRAGSPLTPLLHDLGLTTGLGTGMKDAAGRSMTGAEKERADRLRVWQSRTRVAGSSERNLATATRYLSHLSAQLSLPRDILLRAAKIYREALDAGLVRGRPVNMMTAAAIYVSCRDSAVVPRTLKQIASKAGVKKKEVAKCYRKMVRYTEKRMPVSDPIMYVTEVAGRIQLDMNAQQATIKLLKKAIELRVTAGKCPTGLVAAAMYMAVQKLGLTNYTQKQIAAAADVTEVTVRNRFKGLREALAPYHLLDTQEAA
jgi:transcription initiation factor TFIIB